MRDHEPITIRQFLGTFDRGDDDSVPPGYFKDSRNVRFLTNAVETREGISVDIDKSNIRRIAIYKRIGEAQRLLILDTAGALWDSVNMGAPILSIVAMTDFSMETMYNRAYITPHNGVTGLPGERVYVYEGSGLARPAGGNAPIGFALGLADSADSGFCEPGTHVFAVCNESISGFLSKPGGFASFSPAGEKKIDVSNIQPGPTGTVARVLVATKAIEDYNGDYQNQEYFFVPGGRVSGNITTTATISFFDADLQASADYLLDQLGEIPAGVCIRNYRGRLCVAGENLSPAIVRISNVGNPESHDAIEGYVTVNPGDSGGGVTNLATYRTQLICFKDERTYVTMDNGFNPAFWKVDDIDPSMGCSCHALGKIRDFGDGTEDRLFVANRQGLQLFNGTFSDAVISFDIDTLWSRINKRYFHTIEVVVDPYAYIVFCAVPLGTATSPSHLLVGDYQEGMDKIKWTTWTFPTVPTTVIVDLDELKKEGVFKFGSLNGKIYKLDLTRTDDNNVAIDSYVQFGHLPQEDDERVWHFTGTRIRAKGIGVLDIMVSGEDGVQTQFPPSLLLSTAPGRGLFRGFNFVNERASVKFGVDGFGEKFRLTKYCLYGSVEWETRPE
jgi:hypothetical protein